MTCSHWLRAASRKLRFPHQGLNVCAGAVPGSLAVAVGMSGIKVHTEGDQYWKNDLQPRQKTQ